MSNIEYIFRSLGISIVDSDNALAQRIEVYYIKNRNGSIRWVWPCALKKPLFLKFYNQQGFKAKVFCLIIKLIFALKLKKQAFNYAAMYLLKTQKEYSLDQIDWALFTGTVGPNQKYILYQIINYGAAKFTKIALSHKSKALINNEAEILKQLSSAPIANFAYPEVLSKTSQYLSVLELKDYNQRSNILSDNHIDALLDLKKLNHKAIAFNDWARQLALETRINELQQCRTKIPSGIIKKLRYLYIQLEGTTLNVNLAHGDFTPWNMYTNATGKLYIYDWELANEKYPEGFDFFHFYIQKGVLAEGKNWNTLKTEILAYSSFFKDNTEQEYYLSLYLLTNTLNYLEIYEKQEHWHVQIYWLLNIWNIALSDVLKQSVNNRELLILDIFDCLNYQKYGGLKLLASTPEKLSIYSDIDLLSTKKYTLLVLEKLYKHPLLTKTIVKSKLAVTKVTFITADQEILSIDFIHQLKRKHLQYLDVTDMLNNVIIDDAGIKHVNKLDTLQFIGWFYGLNNHAIPSKYKDFGILLSGDNGLDDIINNSSFTTQEKQSHLVTLLKKKSANRGFSYLKNAFTYVLDTLRHQFSTGGLVVTFSGVDGAGKSTIIEKTKLELEKRLRKNVVVIRHRPSLLPILSAWTKGKTAAEAAAANSLPRQGKNKNTLSSLLRFCYYYSDYLLGQFYVYFMHVLAGKVVLYDRYYFDFINDGHRSNILLPKWIVKLGYALILKPQLNFFLFADAQTILSRKKELDEKTITTLTNDYLLLFGLLGKTSPNQYHAIENISLENTLNFITSKIQSKLI